MGPIEVNVNDDNDDKSKTDRNIDRYTAYEV